VSVPDPAQPHKRRPRYKGKNPRRFEDKYKELNPALHAETIAKVRASGKTPAGQHVPIMVHEILEALAPVPGERVVDCTLGYGGHATELLRAVQPGGCLLGLDQDPIEIARTEPRLRALGFPEEALLVRRTNFAGLLRVLADVGWADGADMILADLGVSSMQIDNPARGFSFKHDGPLDMRMNPQKGQPAGALLQKLGEQELSALLAENADEPRATLLARALCGRAFATTGELARAVRQALPASHTEEQKQAAARRVFQALRIAVNEEFTVLDTWLRTLPQGLRPGGRVAVLTFHSGEDRRVKKAFRAGLLEGLYSEISEEVQRPTPSEVRDNPRAAPAKLRWAAKRED
jgi:16S rRNA (cytosine1402-N4)-methyltransferase